jgi:hypothetical protein
VQQQPLLQQHCCCYCCCCSFSSGLQLSSRSEMVSESVSLRAGCFLPFVLKMSLKDMSFPKMSGTLCQDSRCFSNKCQKPPSALVLALHCPLHTLISRYASFEFRRTKRVQCNSSVNGATRAGLLL